MSKIMILTDSCCDLTKEQIAESGITVLPLMVTLGGETFRETFDKTPDEFYDMLEKHNEIPKHAAINPTQYEAEYQKFYEEGYTDVITVTLNSLGSGTFNNSLIAKDEFYEKNPEAKDKMRIFNLDSKCYTIFYGYPILEAVKKIRKGANADDVVAYLQDWFNVCAVYVVPYSLKYAKKSGRISAAAAFAGELLGLKPIIEFADGKTTTIEKIRGEKNIVPKLLECVEKRMTPQTPYLLMYGRDDALAKEVEKEMTKRVGRKAEMFAKIGCCVSSNIGPDLVALLVRRKNK